MMKTVVIIVAFICLAIPNIFGGVIELKSGLPNIPQFARLPSSDAVNKAGSLADRQNWVRGQLVRQLDRLVAIAVEKHDQRAARQAICLMYILGEMRAARAAPAMVEGIILNPPWPGQEALGISLPLEWGKFPAVQFLTSIGMPSVRAILKLLPHEANALRRRLMVRVLVGVEGRAVTRFRLRRTIKNAPNLQIRANLEAALKDAAVPHPKKN